MRGFFPIICLLPWASLRSDCLCCSLRADPSRELFGFADAHYYDHVENDRIADLDSAILFYRQALDLRPQGRAKRYTSLICLARCLQRRYGKTGSTSDLDESIEFTHAALELCPMGHPERPKVLFTLACALDTRYLKQDKMVDLDWAITHHHEVLDLRPVGYPDRYTSLMNLAICLRRRCEKMGSVSDLDRSIELIFAALDLCPVGHPGHSEVLFALASTLNIRSLIQGGIADLNLAIPLYQQTLSCRPKGHPERYTTLICLARCHRRRYDDIGIMSDLDIFIELTHGALELCPTGHSDRREVIFALACALDDRFLKQDSISDLDLAITHYRAALDLCPAGQPDGYMSLMSLALCLWRRCEKMETLLDLDECIKFRRAALELCPIGSPNRSEVLFALAFALHFRHLRQSAMADLESAISYHREALDLRPVGHAERYNSLTNLAVCLRQQSDKSGTTSILDNCIVLRRLALELCPVGHADRSLALFDLAECLKERYLKRSTITDMDEAAMFHCAALDLRPSGHTARNASLIALEDMVSLAQQAREEYPRSHEDRPVLLSVLARLLVGKFHDQENISVMEEVIALRQEVLQLCPPGHPNHVLSLHELAVSLHFRFERQTKILDLDEAITHSRDAVQQCPPEHPNRLLYLKSLAMFRRRKSEIRRHQEPSTCDSSQIHRLIIDAVHETLQNLPPRLLHTLSGVLCNRDAQMSHFLRSCQYSQLLGLAEVSDKHRYRTLIYEVVTKYFRYATLSHRWGQHEPVFRDVEGQAIHDLDPADGFAKLQSFCVAAGERSYLWGWVDTCCIDKDSTMELQRAIGSMFKWYRRSALTIVHLADVSNIDTDSLGKSMWFKRGWTLQELLAPHTVLFFTQDWLVYRESSSLNHKEDATIVAELEKATRITSLHLTGFHPGTDDARSKLQWASTRCTTLPEDMAYSLFGIFNIHLPILYGESVEQALARLLGEIISRSGDISVLEWVGEPSPFHSCFPASITSYKTLPCPSPDSTLLANSLRSSLQNQLPSGVLRRIHDTLSQLPRPRFSDHRLSLPCIIHRITLVQTNPSSPCSAGYPYIVRAVGLCPLDITSSERLEEHKDHFPYILVRPWHGRSLGPSADINTITDEDLILILSQPFCAFLLKRMPYNEYKRIGSLSTISACPADSNILHHFEIETLTLM